MYYVSIKCENIPIIGEELFKYVVMTTLTLHWHDENQFLFIRTLYVAQQMETQISGENITLIKHKRVKKHTIMNMHMQQRGNLQEWHQKYIEAVSMNIQNSGSIHTGL